MAHAEARRHPPADSPAQEATLPRRELGPIAAGGLELGPDPAELCLHRKYSVKFDGCKPLIAARKRSGSTRKNPSKKSRAVDSKNKIYISEVQGGDPGFFSIQ